MTADERLVTLAERLIERTQAGQLDWEAGGTERFIVGLSSGSVMIQSATGGSGPYAVYVRNKDGTVVEHAMASGEVFGNLLETNPHQKRLGTILPLLYDLVRRQVHGVDETVDAILEELVPEDAGEKF